MKNYNKQDEMYCFIVLFCPLFNLFNSSTTDFLRATAVPEGTAEVRISYGNSVCLSVCPSVRHGPVQKQPSDIETPGLHHMIA